MTPAEVLEIIKEVILDTEMDAKRQSLVMAAAEALMKHPAERLVAYQYFIVWSLITAEAGITGRGTGAAEKLTNDRDRMSNLLVEAFDCLEPLIAKIQQSYE